MSEVASIISSIAALLAALAGLTAVRKWKQEKFEKSLIESADRLHELQVKCLEHLDEISNERNGGSGLVTYENYHPDLDRVAEPLKSFLSYKYMQIDKLEDMLKELDKVSQDVLDFSNYSHLFVVRYLITIKEELKSSMYRLTMGGVENDNKLDLIDQVNTLSHEKRYCFSKFFYAMPLTRSDDLSKTIRATSIINREMRDISRLTRRFFYSGYIGRVFIGAKLYWRKEPVRCAIVYSDGVEWGKYIDIDGSLHSVPVNKGDGYDLLKSKVKGGRFMFAVDVFRQWVYHSIIY
ncbi:hypothetical protein [uncultured Salinicola sp.]|uniref:hypothetical protein n=1 Tax=uncultured Salinicola sp. TaxID=1193542 RepID=UPI002607FA61|nr:hypothetical protein [uncultured Salinicola sp.]|tara:strand:- start:1601 stop:2479 length:879 start_codon:yes stop_codon:yes gene_type:complete